MKRRGSGVRKAKADPNSPDRRQQRGAASRAALKKAAIEVFASKGFNNTTIDDITQAAGLSHAALYLHFDNKETLFGELVSDASTELTERLEPVFKRLGSASPVELVREGGDTILRFYEKRRTFFRAFLLGSNPALTLRGLRGDTNPELRGVFAKVLETYVASQGGKLKDPDGAANALMAIWIRLGLDYLFDEERKPTKARRQQVLDLLVQLTAGAVAGLIQDPEKLLPAF
ncbi:MAG: TetR/AcrR family transcriptional regulator [Myxococcales bacterium]|nr:TetR/AcrR family transcriptional regulator [Myxococcales bacterium]